MHEHVPTHRVLGRIGFLANRTLIIARRIAIRVAGEVVLEMKSRHAVGIRFIFSMLSR